MTPEVVLKAALAEVESIQSTNPNGEFHVILSTSNLDRDGEIVEAKAFEPLPGHITFDIDHGLNVKSVVGSGVPFYAEDGTLQVKGTFASTALGQEVRALVSEGHIRTTSVAMKATKVKSADGQVRIPKAELYNGSFVAVPANREAMVLSAKAADVKAGARHSSADMAHIQAAHDAMCSLGAMCQGEKSVEAPDVKTEAVLLAPEFVEPPAADVETSEPVEDSEPQTTDENDEKAAPTATDAAKAASVTADAAEAVEIARARRVSAERRAALLRR